MDQQGWGGGCTVMVSSFPMLAFLFSNANFYSSETTNCIQQFEALSARVFHTFVP